MEFEVVQGNEEVTLGAGQTAIHTFRLLPGWYRIQAGPDGLVVVSLTGKGGEEVATVATLPR
jgi:hypothetical protein